MLSKVYIKLRIYIKYKFIKYIEYRGLQNSSLNKYI